MRHLRIITLLPGPSKYNPDADITGFTGGSSKTFTIKINGTDYTVTSDNLGRFSFDIPEGVTPTSLYRFMYNQRVVTSVFLHRLDTSSVTDMAEMFRGCDHLGIVKFATTYQTIDTSSVTTMSMMFAGCTLMPGNNSHLVGFKNLDTSSLIYANQMFYNCSHLQSVDLSGWDTSSLSSANSMFSGCGELTELDLSSWDTSSLEASGNYTYMVPDRSTLTVYYDSTKLGTAITGSFPVVNWVDVHQNAIITGSLDSVPPSTNQVLKINGVNETIQIDTSTWPVTFSFEPQSTVTSLNGCFGSLANYVSAIDLSSFDASSVTDMTDMFNGCGHMTSMPNFGSGWDTSSVTSMYGMFQRFGNSGAGVSLSVDLTGWDTSSVTSMNRMFNSPHLTYTKLDLRDWDVRNVTDMSYMFGSFWNSEGCEIRLDNWETSSVTTFTGMFERWSNVTVYYDSTKFSSAIVQQFQNFGVIFIDVH